MFTERPSFTKIKKHFNISLACMVYYHVLYIAWGTECVFVGWDSTKSVYSMISSVLPEQFNIRHSQMRLQTIPLSLLLKDIYVDKTALNIYILQTKINSTFYVQAHIPDYVPTTPDVLPERGISTRYIPVHSNLS